MSAEKKIDETVPGGKYIVGDRYVNANGDDLGPVAASKEKAPKEPKEPKEPNTTDKKDPDDKAGNDPNEKDEK